jgi:hypothetical protein
MPYRVQFGDKIIECDTPEEARRLTLLSVDVDTEVGEFLPGNKIPHHGPWTDILLDRFLHSLGADQKQILSILVTQSRVTAEELRKALNVKTNQALAGVISGISKQAAAIGVGARDVFGIENRRRSGVLSKSFFVADDFLKIAQMAGWPNPPKNKS